MKNTRSTAVLLGYEQQICPDNFLAAQKHQCIGMPLIQQRSGALIGLQCFLPDRLLIRIRNLLEVLAIYSWQRGFREKDSATKRAKNKNNKGLERLLKLDLRCLERLQDLLGLLNLPQDHLQLRELANLPESNGEASYLSSNLSNTNPSTL